MFFPFKTLNQKTRDAAKHWLETALKIYHYRRDQLPPDDLADLSRATENLRQRLKEKADAAKLKLAIENLEAVLRRTGGTLYPKTAWTEWTEFFLVAAIVILGIRAYFVQPFKIPTNSMWPSYNGMTPEVFRSTADEPGAARQALRFLTQLASPHRVNAPASGEILIPVSPDVRGAIPFSRKKGRSWLVLPEDLCEYHLLVGDRWTSVSVPKDFDFGWTLRDAFFPGNELFRDILAQKFRDGSLLKKNARTPDGHRVALFLRTGKFVKAGERVLSFDILTGDQLFVDRVSYHFTRPKVGDGFVFRTDNIHSRNMMTEDGRQVSSYYIKRLAGVPGDVLEITPPLLLRNGAPASGAPAFAWNAAQQRSFGGYTNVERQGAAGELLFPGQKIRVPENSYVALGDNSRNSADSRYWGFVPARDVVGKPLLIYYPFTKHWGPAP